MFVSRLGSHIARIWWSQPLSRQFFFASTTIFLVGMGIAGVWIANRIAAGVTHNTAAATALYFESFIAPLVQSLAAADEIPEDKQRELARLISETSLGRRVVSFKIWLKGGTIVYATRPELVGKHFPPTPKLQRAWNGQVAASFDELNEEENEGEQQIGVPLLEIYAPIRQQHSDRIIAVAEFYERADQLERDIFEAKLDGWLIIGAIAACAMPALFAIVGRASTTIDRQIAELRALVTQNEELRRRAERSSQLASEVNERYLRRLGSELHDGPAQLLGLALLRLDAVERGGNRGADAATEVETIRMALRDALAEIRNISVGLSLPELERLSLRDTLQAAVRDHTRRTNTAVEADVGRVDGDAVHTVKTAAFRFVQEALNNATRHAGGVGQSVRARQDEAGLIIEVGDRGSGFDPGTERPEGKLGLVGMRERIESVGGEFSIRSAAGGGTCLKIRLPLQPQDS
jgi:signal transduction histidine kinase